MGVREEFQQKAMEFETIRQQLGGIQQELNELQGRLGDYETVKETLNQIKGKKGEKIMAPLGGGVMINATLEREKVLINIGSRVMVEHDIKKAKEIVESRIDELGERVNALQKNAEHLNKDMMDLEPELEKLSKKMRG